jgi:hypothetical protein
MKTLKALAIGTVPMVGLAVVLCLFQVSAIVVKVARDEGRIAVQVTAALDTVNRECAPMQACGTLAEVDKALTHGSDLIVQSQKAVRDADRVTTLEAAMLPQWNAGITQTLEHVNGMVAVAASSTQQMTAAAVPVLASVDATVKDADAATVRLNALIASTEVTDTLQHVDAATASIADSTRQADAILTDAREEADKLAHPPKKKLTFWGVILAGGDAARHFMPSIF